MHKLIVLLIMGLLLTGTTVFASPTAAFEKGAISLEIGSTLNSKVSGKGRISADVTGKSGFKVGITAGLSDLFALQYKQGMFKSKDTTISGITTYAQAEPSDINLLYKLNPTLTLITGYEHTKISYGEKVSAASKSALHIGFMGTHKLNDKTILFATLLGGRDVSLKEIGVSYKMSQGTTFNLSLAERKLGKLDLTVPALGITDGKEDYTMKGITFMFAYKL